MVMPLLDIALIILMALAAISLAAALVGQLKKVRQQREDIEERDRQIHNLQTSIALSQIKPHFLYNSLNSIYVLCGIDLEKGRQAISDLSDYLRINIGSIDSKIPIPFEKELEHVKKYISLEQLRFPDEFTVSYDTPVTDFSIPALTIQPLVENSVRHGVIPKGGGVIVVSTRENEKEYIIKVEDNGMGYDKDPVYDEDRLDEDDDNAGHIGIRNVRERLSRLCGGRLDIRSHRGYGTEVTIHIPKSE